MAMRLATLLVVSVAIVAESRRVQLSQTAMSERQASQAMSERQASQATATASSGVSPWNLFKGQFKGLFTPSKPDESFIVPATPGRKAPAMPMTSPTTEQTQLEKKPEKRAPEPLAEVKAEEKDAQPTVITRRKVSLHQVHAVAHAANGRADVEMRGWSTEYDEQIRERRRTLKPMPALKKTEFDNKLTSTQSDINNQVYIATAALVIGGSALVFIGLVRDGII